MQPAPADTATESIAALPGVGRVTLERLGRLGIYTVADLLLHLPFRYEDHTTLVRVGTLSAGATALVAGVITALDQRRGLACTITDSTGQLRLRFYRIHAAHAAQFAIGRTVYAYGRCRMTPWGLEFSHPECRFDEAALPTVLTPVYRTVSGLSQVALRRLLQGAIARMPQPFKQPLAALAGGGYASMAAALEYAHAPPPAAEAGLMAGTHPAIRRLALEELLAFELRRHRQQVRRVRQKALPLPPGRPLFQGLLTSLPFQLTPHQHQALALICADLGRPAPMRRLLQGDVGCGKTIVAALACAQAVDAGAQAAIMAPTELLAEQHLRNFRAWFEPLGVAVVAVLGAARAEARRGALAALAGDQPLIAVGTHALFQAEVRFGRLALIVIDEQHRFGVRQRSALAAKGRTQGRLPHQLVMTATPIPRTLAQTFYADLDVTEIRGRPAGRPAVTTAVLPASRRPELIERVRGACSAGRQVYWVCPAIEDSALELQAAVAVAAELGHALPGIVVGLAHGRLSSALREQAMRDFADGKTRVLVATTVVEVGVDVPEASLMVIEHADRMGLAQLHQLRGRVGRGAVASHCLLLYEGPLSLEARRRLECLRTTQDGFEVAEQDLALRGPGELFGGRQAGHPAWRVADLMRDRSLLAEATALASLMQQQDPAAARHITQCWEPLHDLATRT